MQQIADWLRKLGMSEYAERFAENGIDLSSSRSNGSGPEKLGVVLGDRRKMLRAIANWTPRGTASTGTPAVTPAPLRRAAATSVPVESAESADI